jgi:hypothetical protein
LCRGIDPSVRPSIFGDLAATEDVASPLAAAAGCAKLLIASRKNRPQTVLNQGQKWTMNPEAATPPPTHRVFISWILPTRGEPFQARTNAV